MSKLLEQSQVLLKENEEGQKRQKSGQRADGVEPGTLDKKKSEIEDL